MAENLTRKERREKERRKRKLDKQCGSDKKIDFFRRYYAVLIFLAIFGGGSIATYKILSKDNAEKSAEIAAGIATEKFKYNFKMDGFKIESNTVRPDNFKKIYEEVKKIIGGIYWNPAKLNVEYGDVAKEAGYDERSATASWTSLDLDEIISNPEDLRHELIHFLLGKEVHKWPVPLQEFFASAGDNWADSFRYEDLDEDWVQMPTEKSIMVNGPISTARYAAMQRLAHRHIEKLPQIAKDLLGRTDITFENMAEVLKEYGVEHKILHPGESGEFQAFMSNKDVDRGDGFIYVRYKRIKGNTDEYGWNGQFRITIIDDTEEQYVQDGTMSGMVFISRPPTTKKIVKVRIEHADGFVFEKDLK